MNSLYRKDQCQSPDPTASSFAPSFAAVAAGVDRNMDKDIHSKYILTFFKAEFEMKSNNK